jgi:hypothetical protein
LSFEFIACPVFLLSSHCIVHIHVVFSLAESFSNPYHALQSNEDVVANDGERNIVGSDQGVQSLSARGFLYPLFLQGRGFQTYRIFQRISLCYHFQYEALPITISPWNPLSFVSRTLK